MADLSKRIADYAYRFWMRAGMTEWPSVKRTARSLRIRQEDIENAEHGGDFCITQYLCDPPEPFGDHNVEAMTPAVDEAWKQYYAAR